MYPSVGDAREIVLKNTVRKRDDEMKKMQQLRDQVTKGIRSMKCSTVALTFDYDFGVEDALDVIALELSNIGYLTQVSCREATDEYKIMLILRISIP